VNELALLCERMHMDVWEVIRAASTKPFGFMPFSPGAGVGGHCIPIDPLYLSWKAREYDFHTNFIDLAAEVNESMPYHVVELVLHGLSQRGRGIQGSRVLVLGVAFKRDIDDARNSPAERVIELLLQRGAQVQYHDQYVPHYTIGPDAFCREKTTLSSVPLAEALAQCDCAVIVTGHRHVDYQQVIDCAPLVVDCCHAAAGLKDVEERVVRLGRGAVR
jgi:UDP-N-acetyl-D-glucosamine dehydrogenase